jgi:hypothetical protein
MQEFLDRLHERARRNPAFQRLAIISRILLGLAFLPTGLVKLMGDRFTIISIENPIGAFFEAMYQTGAYWQFLGLSQMLAAVLLLIPRTATLGAVVFFPIAVNIFVITVALDFRGTPFMTAGILLASIFLLCWDYDRLKTIVWPSAERPRIPAVPVGKLERTGYLIGTAAGLAVFGALRGLVPGQLVPASLGIGLIAVVIVLIAWVRAMRTPAPDPGMRTA